MTNQPWEIEKIRNNVKYLTNGTIVLTDEEAEICHMFLDKEGEDIKATVEADYHLEWENKEYNGILVFTDYRVLFFSRIDSGERELDILQTYEYPFISNVTTRYETSSQPQLAFTFKGSKKDLVVFHNIERTKLDTLISLMNHYRSIRKRKDYKRSRSWPVIVAGVFIAAFFFLGLIGIFFGTDEMAEEGYEAVYNEYEDWEELAPEININDNQIEVVDLLAYTISETYFTNAIEPPNYHNDYPTIIQLSPEDNTLYYVIELKATNLTKETIDPIIDIPIRFTLMEDEFYEFYSNQLFLNEDLSDFDFVKKMYPEEIAHMYMYFEVPKKLRDNDHRIDLKVDNFYDFEGQLINFR